MLYNLIMTNENTFNILIQKVAKAFLAMTTVNYTYLQYEGLEHDTYVFKFIGESDRLQLLKNNFMNLAYNLDVNTPVGKNFHWYFGSADKYISSISITNKVLTIKFNVINLDVTKEEALTTLLIINFIK